MLWGPVPGTYVEAPISRAPRPSLSTDLPAHMVFLEALGPAGGRFVPAASVPRSPLLSPVCPSPVTPLRRDPPEPVGGVP